MKNLEIVVPYPAGGATDSIGHIVQDILAEAGYSAEVKNIPGDNNAVGAEYAIKNNAIMIGCATSIGANLA